jgi:hypothetical protein
MAQAGSGTITVIIPAEEADRMTLGESSSAKHRRGSTPSRSAAFRKGLRTRETRARST